MTTYNASIEVYPHISRTTAIKRIEEIGRVCYKSEEKIKEDSAEGFVRGLIKRGHTSVIEHATFCVVIMEDDLEEILGTVQKLELLHGFRSYLRITNVVAPLVSGNARAWRNFFIACTKLGYSIPRACQVVIRGEPVLFAEWQEYVFTKPSSYPVRLFNTNELTNHTERMVHHDFTVKFICDRGVSHEFVRHRVAAMSQESTRYCNYSGDLGVVDLYSAFGFDRPGVTESYDIWKEAVRQCEENYSKMIASGSKAEEARSVLINSTKTELVMTMNGAGWYNFIRLRNAKAAHPQAREQAEMLHGYFVEKALWVLQPLEVEA